MSNVKTIEWKDGAVRLIDQSLLPHREVYVECHSWRDVADAIRTMKIRGAPAIGVATAFGIALAASESRARTPEQLFADLRSAAAELAQTRPTAVNLTWALHRMLELAAQSAHIGVEPLKLFLVREGQRICDEDIEINHRIGEHGAKLLEELSSQSHQKDRDDMLHLLTHCNAGALATAGYGTALGVIRSAAERGRKVHVWVDETRPWLQGSRLTVWELSQDHIPTTLIADSMAASFMRAGKVDAVIVGADRIARNGDVANKIGTYNVAILARHHQIPFCVAAPVSTIDFSIASGTEIPIEERDPAEVTTLGGQPIAPSGAHAANPVFDVTPNELVTAIITERGVMRPPFEKAIEQLIPARD